MQREIKFRGQRIDTKEWVYGLLMTNHLGSYIITEENPHECHLYGYIEIDEYYKVIPETVGQYTGLNDKNDKEIYIGDITKCLEVTDTRTDEYISEVFEEECEVLVHDSRTSDTPIAIFFPHPNQIPLTEIEIIGNIYDNPELLQEVD
jgi:uncharacterized phage protein (TIGR01671 family)